MNKMTKGEQSKNKLIECAAELFLKNGYNATGINDILAKTGLPKGSFYFHFSSKKELAIEVAAYFEKKVGQWIIDTARGKDWEHFVQNLTDDMIKGVQNNAYFGCPFAVLGTEIAFTEPDIAEHYSAPLEKLKDIFASVFKFSGIPEDKCPAIACRACAVYEGYLIYFRVSRDTNVLSMMAHDLIDIYNNYRLQIS